MATSTKPPATSASDGCFTGPCSQSQQTTPATTPPATTPPATTPPATTPPATTPPATTTPATTTPATTTPATATPATKTPLQALAARIAAHADAIAAAGHRLSHPARSLVPSPASPSRLLPADAPPSVRAEQVLLRDALAEASLLATDASSLVPDLAVKNNMLGCLRWLVHFDIPQLLPLTVSKTARVAEHQLRRIARMAILAAGFLSEPVPNQLAHSPLSAAMVAQPDLLKWLRFMSDTSAPTVPAMVEAMERWGRDPPNEKEEEIEKRSDPTQTA
ncbi:hypothetical protein B0H63DRAFT_533829 [Podospora didyma]|uniref:Uncharacterized protein n=1 Tax=Podospora didyma TaxID=330526 RepID=A0AAE0U8S3_9PEZI|nr:hypothetical protein B0H63DRAFT_533829 [Podospora didyma]